MFAIFSGSKQLSEEVSTLEIAKELMKLHRKQNPKAKLEIKARILKHNPNTTKRRRGWVKMDEYSRQLKKHESGGLF